MVIHDGDFGRTLIGPAKDDAPLIIDSDGVEAPSVSLERFEAIAGGNGKVGELARLVELGSPSFLK